MEFSLVGFIWILVILATLIPAVRQRRLAMERISFISSIQRERGSRVITMIHRQESLAFLGIPLRRFIDIEDSEEVLRAIRLTPDDMPIDLVLHTPGGLVLASEQIASALRRHPGKITVFVPHYAMSGGTMIALAADEIVMDENAVLGPLDPQVGQYPAASILQVLKDKNPNRIDDETLILADISRKAIRQLRESVSGLLDHRMDAERAAEVAASLTSGQWTHDFPINCSFLRGMGIDVSCNPPDVVYRLMDLYPQLPQRRPSIQYVPLPNAKSEGDRGSRVQ